MCFDDSAQQRLFAIQMQKAGMDADEYVFILADTDMQNG